MWFTIIWKQHTYKYVKYILNWQRLKNVNTPTSWFPARWLLPVASSLVSVASVKAKLMFRNTLNTKFENTALRFRGCFAFTPSPLPLVRISVSHAHSCQGLYFGKQLKRMVGSPAGLLELKGLLISCMNALPCLLLTFSFQFFQVSGFCTLILYFCKPCSPEVSV